MEEVIAVNVTVTGVAPVAVPVVEADDTLQPTFAKVILPHVIANVTTSLGAGPNKLTVAVPVGDTVRTMATGAAAETPVELVTRAESPTKVSVVNAFDFVGSVTDWAVMVTVAGDGAVAGAVYRPEALMVPQFAGTPPAHDTLHVTPFPGVSGSPVTVVVNCADPTRIVIGKVVVVTGALTVILVMNVTLPLVALVTPGLVAVNAYVPAMVKCKLEKVATPLAAVTATVPLTTAAGFAGVDEYVDCRVTTSGEVVATLPKGS
ncbi:MAG: hypothetical protein ABSA96_20525 [Candidatus Acidiferrales bacterium]